jgi:hypothetical protein
MRPSEPRHQRTDHPDVVDQTETLTEQVARKKHRWLKRVAYDRATGSSEKAFAYLVMDYLNCVSLDCWPSQKKIADKFGWSTKTVHRVADALERRGYLRIARSTQGSYRYAPLFLPEDEDKSGRSRGQNCPPTPDKNVGQSFLGILTNKSTPGTLPESISAPRYDPAQRGRFEAEVAKRLGDQGFEILAQLSEHDDAIVERLCRAYANGELGERELAAAHLVAQQLPRKRMAS